MRLHSKALLGMLVVLLLSSTGLAATSATGTNTVAPTLAISVNVQSGVELTLATGTSGPAPCPINPGGGGDYNLSFGNVNGLGLGTPTCGAVTADASGATYATSYHLTPRFSGQSSATGSIVLTAPAFANPSILTLKEGATTPTLVAVPAAPGPAQITGLASGTAVERYLGVTVSNASPGFTGADTTIVTFTMTVP
jgi:hypothetical protein